MAVQTSINRLSKNGFYMFYNTCYTVNNMNVDSETLNIFKARKITLYKMCGIRWVRYSSIGAHHKHILSAAHGI